MTQQEKIEQLKANIQVEANKADEASGEIPLDEIDAQNIAEEAAFDMEEELQQLALKLAKKEVAKRNEEKEREIEERREWEREQAAIEETNRRFEATERAAFMRKFG